MPKETMTATQQAILTIIERDMNLTEGSLFINELTKGNPAVFFEKNGVSACVCAIGSSYWNECAAKAETSALIARISSPNNDARQL